LYQCNNEKSKLKTMVKWTLAGEGASTKLVLEHNGFVGLKDLMTKIALSGGWKKMMNETLYNMVAKQ
jgi:RNA:NAD 2'-phosphotransferase (TPT1/KptA family)